MLQTPLSNRVSNRLMAAARAWARRSGDVPIGPLLDKTFGLPEGDPRYWDNALTPRAAPFEPELLGLQAMAWLAQYRTAGPRRHRRRPARRGDPRNAAPGRPNFRTRRAALVRRPSEAWRGFGPQRAGIWRVLRCHHRPQRSGGRKAYYETRPNQMRRCPGTAGHRARRDPQMPGCNRCSPPCHRAPRRWPAADFRGARRPADRRFPAGARHPGAGRPHAWPLQTSACRSADASTCRPIRAWWRSARPDSLPEFETTSCSA